MPIRFSEQDRARLQRLEGARLKPTRRQKAIALLRLAAGLSPAEAATHAGMPKEDVEALLTVFRESGLAGVGLGEKPKIRVRLVRLGVGIETHRLPEAATVADLLRRSGATMLNQHVYVDGVLADVSRPLHDGAVAIIVPQLRNAAGEAPWHATIPSFRDDALYQQYTETLNARRKDLGTDEDSEK